jgi:hypothetical protein
MEFFAREAFQMNSNNEKIVARDKDHLKEIIDQAIDK